MMFALVLILAETEMTLNHVIKLKYFEETCSYSTAKFPGNETIAVSKGTVSKSHGPEITTNH